MFRAGAVYANVPLVAVVGATGTGKSKLAIDLALAVGGEIINADAVQMYKGLDIATNKVTPEEAQGVPHHLLGFADPFSELIVSDFSRLATKKVLEIHDRGRVPILVGGTNYYIQSVVWDTLLEPDCDDEGAAENDVGGEHDGVVDMGLTAPQLHAQLAEVDPAMARVLHPNDLRKIRRSLEVYHAWGRPHSSLLAEQGNTAARTRFPRTLFLWVDCALDVLYPRLNARVDTMVQRGLLAELRAHARAWRANVSATSGPSSASSELPNFTHGALQTIGFKEFRDVVFRADTEADEAQSAARDETSVSEGIEATKTATRRYAKRQVSWLRLQLCKRIAAASSSKAPTDGAGGIEHRPILRRVDASDLSRWESIRDTATAIARAFVAGDTSNVLLRDESPAIVSTPDDPAAHAERRAARTCERCPGKILMGEKEWLDHVKSKGHRRSNKRRPPPEESPSEGDAEKRRAIEKEGGVVARSGTDE